MKILRQECCWLVSVALSVGAFAGFAAAGPGEDSAQAVSLGAETASGRHLTLTFAGDAVTRASNAATLCGSSGAPVQEARLWMPDMGHGSAPTRLEAMSPDCTRVTNIRFIMGGSWEIQVLLSDGDRGAFVVNIPD